MSSYTVEFEFTSQMVEATDTDMAVIKAAEASELSATDRGELLSVTRHGKVDAKYLTAKGAENPFANGRPLHNTGKPAAPKLPSRRQAGLTLTYDNGDLMVISFGYSASLACAFHEEELNHDKGRHEPKQLSKKQNAIVSKWMDCQAEYYEANGWKTWGEIQG